MDKNKRKNPNMARIGKKNGFYGKHHSNKTKEKISKKGTGRKLSKETKDKISKAFQGSKSYMFRKPKSQEIKDKISESLTGRSHSIKTRVKMSNAQRGERGSNWQGGKSFEIYSEDWTDDLKESIRKRDKHICQECGIHQDELKRKLDVHHIDYDKKNLNPKNLISLCRSCHIKTNYNRDYWIQYFSKL